MTAVEIGSPSNPRIKRLVALRRRRDRDQEGVFLVEGQRELLRAVAAGLQPLEVYWEPGRFSRIPARGKSETTVSPQALDRASYRGRSQGVIAVFPQFEIDLPRLTLAPQPLVLVAQGVEKPGNLGALLRIADGVGADALIAADPGIDPFNPNVIRASTGALFTVPLARAEIGEVLDWLGAAEVRIVAAHPEATTTFWSADLTGSCALVVGSEHLGLDDTILTAADETVSIPMHGGSDSLNLSVSMALLAYEALRQRRT